ncbi:hypothetical protein BD626DRAFT_479085 [Schizophyllum amplum]|uniref:Uncharacterized protein n=1 Tax=Schizophyllum amplum TaxID=97359 RepID=A0A550CRV2_9AGAR|nr:hypothetical protein BD626DRAFT_479085 [Auriculariopsis ampla]
MSNQPEETQEPEQPAQAGAQPQAQPESEVAPTDYYAYVLASLPLMTREGAALDQEALRRCLELSSSYLATDTTTAPERGMQSWFTGFDRLADVVVALHGRGQLEPTTMSTASRACSECWSVAGSWRELAPCRDGVRKIATRLKRLLDENGKTYKGETIYAP